MTETTARTVLRNSLRGAVLALALAPLALGPLPTRADDAVPMTAAAFEAYSTGKTLSYAIGDKPYGAELYLPGRKVLWAFTGDECRHGTWYESKGEICFVYEADVDGPQCWTFYRSTSGLKAHFAGDPPGTNLIGVDQSPSPLSCPGPRVGA